MVICQSCVLDWQCIRLHGSSHTREMGVREAWIGFEHGTTTFITGAPPSENVSLYVLIRMYISRNVILALRLTCYAL